MLKVLKTVLIIIFVVAMFYAYNLVGLSDLEEELGYELHDTAWYLIRSVSVLTVIFTSMAGLCGVNWIESLSVYHLKWMERNYGKNNLSVRLYRKALYTFKY